MLLTFQSVLKLFKWRRSVKTMIYFILGLLTNNLLDLTCLMVLVMVVMMTLSAPVTGTEFGCEQ